MKKTYKAWMEDKNYYFEWTDNECVILKFVVFKHLQQAIFFEELLSEAGYEKGEKETANQ